jgi:hypothetical protein
MATRSRSRHSWRHNRIPDCVIQPARLIPQNGPGRTTRAENYEDDDAGIRHRGNLRMPRALSIGVSAPVGHGVLYLGHGVRYSGN